MDSWISGNGYQIDVGGTFTISDPADIDLGSIGVWSGVKVTLNGVTKLVGSRDTLQTLRVTVPGTQSVTLNTAGDSWQTVTLTNPSGETATASGKILRVEGPRLTPNSPDGNQKIVTIELGPTVADGGSLTPN